MSLSDQYSTTAGWLIPFFKAMQSHGIDVESIMGDEQQNRQLANNPEARLPISRINEAVYKCIQKVGNSFVLDVANNVHPGTFHALGYAVMTSSNLTDALEKIARYKRIVSNTCGVEIERKDEYLIFNIAPFEDSDGNMLLNTWSVELFMASVLKFARDLKTHDLTLKRCDMRHKKELDDDSYLRDFFGCEVYYEQPGYALYFDLNECEAPLLSAAPTLNQVHQKLLEEAMTRVDKNNLAHQITNRIYDLLPLGTPSQSDIANELNMSLRNLQRKLNEQGTSFKEILEDSRKKLAKEYILQPHLALGEISYLLGFSSVGNFNRAFKRWYDDSPGCYRSKLTQ